MTLKTVWCLRLFELFASLARLWLQVPIQGLIISNIWVMPQKCYYGCLSHKACVMFWWKIIKICFILVNEHKMNLSVTQNVLVPNLCQVSTHFFTLSCSAIFIRIIWNVKTNNDHRKRSHLTQSLANGSNLQCWDTSFSQHIDTERRNSHFEYKGANQPKKSCPGKRHIFTLK